MTEWKEPKKAWGGRIMGKLEGDGNQVGRWFQLTRAKDVNVSDNNSWERINLACLWHFIGCHRLQEKENPIFGLLVSSSPSSPTPTCSPFHSWSVRRLLSGREDEWIFIIQTRGEGKGIKKGFFRLLVLIMLSQVWSAGENSDTGKSLECKEVVMDSDLNAFCLRYTGVWQSKCPIRLEELEARRGCPVCRGPKGTCKYRTWISEQARAGEGDSGPYTFRWELFYLECSSLPGPRACRFRMKMNVLLILN